MREFMQSTAWRLRNTGEKQNRAVLGVVGGFLLATEVYKIVFHLTVDPYDWGFFGCFPFQLCSVPMYLCVICALCKNERVGGGVLHRLFFPPACRRKGRTAGMSDNIISY